MDFSGLSLAARFSLSPNQKGYCGKGSAPDKFRRCITGGETEGVADELSKFIVLFPYLRTIGEINKKGPFALSSAEAYWLGNDDLKKAGAADYERLLDHFSEQGVPDFFVKELRENKPKVFLPFHLFQVLFVGVGRASGAVPFNLTSANECMIRWGRVVEIEKDKEKARVLLVELERKGKRLELVEKEEDVLYETELVEGITKGAIVAVHWGRIAKILTEREAENLKRWTGRVLETVEPSWPSARG